MTYEKSKQEDSQELKKFKSDRVTTPIIEYFWNASPLSRNRKNSLHNFLRNIKVLSKLSDYEIRLLSQFLHEREFEQNEEVFSQGDRGFGFYIIYSGAIEIYLQKKRSSGEPYEEHIVNLIHHQYFGELALLDDNDVRNASARAKQSTTLLALFRPDLEELIERHPVVAAKLLQAISLIITKRFIGTANEVQILKDKIRRLEENEEQKAD
jgi:CRP/FNR family cyclic AMP-dependent transcriptional regulator